MIPPRAVESRTSFWRDLAGRLGTRWRTKIVGNVLALSAFFWAYFWVLAHPIFQPFEMPVTVLDEWIGFSPSAIALYGSLWLYLSLPLALLKRTSELISFGVGTVAIAATGLAIFVVWPTTIPVFDVVWSQHPGTAFLKGVDASGNACPSLHVAFSVFAASWLRRLLQEMGAERLTRTVNWLWCAAILYSTIATRQHVVLDVVAGAALGASVVATTFLWLRGDALLADTRRPVQADRESDRRHEGHFANSGITGSDVPE